MTFNTKFITESIRFKEMIWPVHTLVFLDKANFR